MKKIRLLRIELLICKIEDIAKSNEKNIQNYEKLQFECRSKFNYQIFAIEIFEHTFQCNNIIYNESSEIITFNEKNSILQKWDKFVDNVLNYSLLKIFDYQSSWIRCRSSSLCFTNLNATKFHIYTNQCAYNEFVSFLKRWNLFIKIYNISYLNIYYITRCVCVFENFNCMLFDNWILILDIEFLIF